MWLVQFLVPSLVLLSNHLADESFLCQGVHEADFLVIVIVNDYQALLLDEKTDAGVLLANQF